MEFFNILPGLKPKPVKYFEHKPLGLTKRQIRLLQAKYFPFHLNKPEFHTHHFDAEDCPDYVLTDEPLFGLLLSINCSRL